MPSTSARKRNRAALTGAGSRRAAAASSEERWGTPRLRTLLLLLLLTTLSLLGLQAYRFHKKGALPFASLLPSVFPASLEERAAKLQSQFRALGASAGGEDDVLAYDSSQWKARLAPKGESISEKLKAKIPLKKGDSAAERLQRAKEKLVDLRKDVQDAKDAEGDALPTDELTTEDLQAMFDLLQGRGAYADAAGGDADSDPAAASRQERFGRLRQAMGAAAHDSDEL